MQQSTLVVLLLAGSALVGGCASADSRYDGYDNRGAHYNGVRQNEGYYAVVVSIRSTQPTRGASTDNVIAGTVRSDAELDAYRVRIRFDDGSYQTMTQASIGTLHVGDSVRIENERVVRY